MSDNFLQMYHLPTHTHTHTRTYTKEHQHLIIFNFHISRFGLLSLYYRFDFRLQFATLIHHTMTGVKLFLRKC